jgi:hypothetical protein
VLKPNSIGLNLAVVRFAVSVPKICSGTSCPANPNLPKSLSRMLASVEYGMLLADLGSLDQFATAETYTWGPR